MANSKKMMEPETRETYFQVRVTPSEKQELKDVALAIKEPASRIARYALKQQLREIRERLANGEAVSI